MKTAQQGATNWVDSAGRAATAYKDGVQSYSGDWAGATVAQQGTLLTNVTSAITSGKWASGIQRAASTWKADTIAKAPNYSTGFTAGAARQAASMTKIMNALGNIVPSLPPRGDYQQNKLRATTLMDDLHSLAGTLGAS